jgi:hypothetical protein
MSLLDACLTVQFAGVLGFALPQSVFDELDQPVNQPLLPTDDVEAAFVAMLLQDFADAAF